MAAVTECGSLLKHIIMNIESKEFWEKVKEEYKPLGDKYELCFHSATFMEEWHKDRISIIEIARKFAIETKKIEVLEIGVGWLFHCNSNKTNANVRKQFLDYCIQKYSK